MNHEQIHSRAIEIAGCYRKSVGELLDILQTLDARKTYREYECTSLFQYAVRYLNLSEDVAYNFITVARKACEVPALKQEIATGAITVAKVRKTCPILTLENQGHWLGVAKEVPTKELERQVAHANPKPEVPESANYVSGDRLRMVLGVSRKFMEMLARAQDLESQSTQGAVNREGALLAALEAYLERRDLVRRAERITKARAVRLKAAAAKALRSDAGVLSDVTTKYIAVRPVSTSRT